VPTGDALPAELVRRWFAAHPDIPLLNTYGVTECSDDQCHAVISEPPGPDSGPIATIGTPVGGMRAYVLTADLALAPAGVPGELYLAGTGVGRGYRAQPGLTAGRFVPDPFGEPGARLYRTGDVVRLRPAGDLEFFGRSDNQVKVRGFRIEPGEIETALTGHPAVREALVSTHGPAGPERRLVAYVVAETDRVPAAEIRRFASDVLPDYMVPDYVVWLDRFPLTAHGKLDRAALPGPGPASHEHAGGTSVILSDPVEEMVAEVWHQVLGRRPVPGDDFFDSGGNSLLAIGLLSGIRAACDVRLSLADLLRSPTVAGIAATVRSALREGLPVASLTEIPRAEPGSVVPLSFAQERMWVIEQVAQAPALYAVPVTLKLSLAATDEDLRHAVGQLLARHEVLRTRIREQDGRPVQITADTEDTADTVEPPLIVTDLSAMDPDQRDRHTDDLFTVDAQRGVALDQAPLVRVHAVRYAADEIVLQILLHHAITDAWSNDLVVRDLVELVTAAKDRRPPRLPAPPVRYADFAAWQRSQLTAQRSAALLDHWTDRLADAPEMSTFPADRPRPAGQSHRGGRHEFTLPPDLAAAVRRLARSEQATAFMVLATAFGVLLGSASGQDDLVIGIPMSGRDHPQLREVVGLFVNTVPLRMDLSGRPTFTEALRRVRQACLDAYAHADLPFESLIQRLRPRRSLARHPVFQVMLTMQSTPEWSHERRKPIAAPYPAPSTGTAKFDLHLYVVERGGHWNLMIEYATDLFDLATVERLAGGFTVLLGSAIADPGRPISGLNRLTVAERQLIETWATGPVTGLETVPATLPDLLAAGVRASPDGPAIRWDGISLSYRDFQTAVTGLAVRLRELGVGPESVVGVCLDRSADLVIAVHAVVAAGAAYLPLPPSHPVRRLHMLTGDAGAAVVICEQSTMDNFAGCAVRLVDAGERAGSSLRVPGCLPDSLAYVIHTSGSTGRPKGVQVGHRAVVNRLSWMQRLFPVGPGDRVLHKTPFGFDVSVWELFWPLAYGAELVVGQPDLHRDPHRLWEVLDEERVALVHFVPAMLGPFLDVVAARGRPPSTLRTIVCSGEQLPARLVNRAYQVMPDVGLHNLYGPTEAAVDVTWHPCAPADVVPIGRPMDNVRAEVLDAEYGRVPPGTRGSLYLGGIQLARGYAGSPGLTASRFVPDPFGPAGSRLYDTGDLARWLPDGTMEFLGRADFQVKVRGMRIEPVEVEVALSAHADVADAVVVADEGRLIAYVVPHAGLMPSQSVLRSHLAGMLPDYQIPARFVVLAQFPLTATGKIDRAALPAPEGHLPHRAATHVPPAGRTQQVLAAIWQQVLGVGPVGADDNFFELGGDSIMSLLVVSRAAEAGVRVAPRQFFDHQTVAELAAVAQDATGRQAPSRSLSRVDDETMARVVAMLRIQDGQADVRP
jgi:amino acid adenylation domain-containing protein